MVGAEEPRNSFCLFEPGCLSPSLHIVAPFTPVCEAAWAIMVQICS